MHKKTKTIFGGFLTTDYKAMIEQLEDMARQGWMLEKIGGVTAKFKAIPPQELKYYVDVFPVSGVFDRDNNPELLEYRKLCEESGWDFVTAKGHLQVFCSAEDAQAIPIQTDLEIEEKIISSTIMKNEYLGILLFFIVAIYNLFQVGNFDYYQLLTFTGVAATYVFPLAIVPMLIWAIYMVVWNVKLRKYVKNGEPMPVPSLKSAKIRGRAFHYILFSIIILMLLAFVGDALTGSPFVLVALIPPLLGAMIGLPLKKYFKASQDDKKTKVIILVIGLVVAVVLAQVITFGVFSGFLAFDKDEEVPKGVPILKLEDFSLDEQADIEVQSFDRKSSPIVPKYFKYWEFAENRLSIRSEYYRAINPYFAKLIFTGKLEDETRYQEAFPAPVSDWNAEEAYYIGDGNKQALILKDNVVVYIEGDFDLSKPEIRDVVINKLLK